MSKLVRNYVNQNFSIRDEYEEIFGRVPHHGKIFCPFHMNTNTPAAKVYGNVIHCFSCNRQYTVYDLLKQYNPKKLEQLEREELPSVETKTQSNPIKPVNVSNVTGIENKVRRILEENQLEVHKQPLI